MKNNRQLRKQLKLQLLSTIWWQPLRKKMTPFRQLVVRILVELFIESGIETSRNWPAERFMVEALDNWIHERTPLKPDQDLGLLMFGFGLRMAALGHAPDQWWEQYVIAEIDVKTGLGSLLKQRKDELEKQGFDVQHIEDSVYVTPAKNQSLSPFPLPYLRKRKAFDPDIPPNVNKSFSKVVT